MPLTTTLVLQYALAHFQKKGDHVAIVCVGPRSEQWFNGEVRIALIKQYAAGTWKCITAEKTIPGGRIDVFSMDGEKGNEADGAIEGKHAQQDDTDGDISSACYELRRQMVHRKKAIPACPVFGLVYATFTYQVSEECDADADDDSLSCPIIDTEGTFFERVRNAAVKVFGETAVSQPGIVFAKDAASLGNWKLLTSFALIAVDGQDDSFNRP